MNDHVARFAAWGAEAAHLFSEQPWDYAYGAGSALERFAWVGGRILLLGKSCRFKQFDLPNVEELPKDRVHSQQCSCHPAGSLEKVSTRGTSSNCSLFYERGGEPFNTSLSCGLTKRVEFFVRHNLCRNGGWKCGSFPSRGKMRK